MSHLANLEEGLSSKGTKKEQGFISILQVVIATAQFTVLLLTENLALFYIIDRIAVTQSPLSSTVLAKSRQNVPIAVSCVAAFGGSCHGQISFNSSFLYQWSKLEQDNENIISTQWNMFIDERWAK